MDVLRYQLLHAHKHITLFLSTIITSFFAFTTVPSFIPFALHLAVLLFYAPHLLTSRSWIFIVWLFLSLSKCCHWIGPSLNALSTPFTSVLVLLVHGAFTNFISLCLVLVFTRSRTRAISTGTQAYSSWTLTMLFPTLWATTWWALAYFGPVGYLMSWSPVIGFSAYDWLVPVFGSPIRDWLVAAWAVVLSAAAERAYMGSESPEEAPLLVQVQAPQPIGSRNPSESYYKGRFALGVGLLVLTIPSYIWPGVGSGFGLPLPISSSDSTPLAVGCALPVAKHNQLSFKDYVEESKKMNAAHIILWPEGAVSFEDEEEREKSFAIVRKNITNPYVGVSFEETYRDPDGRSLRRSGIALVSKSSNKTELMYYKRNLVPIAESYRLQKSDNHPPLVAIDVKTHDRTPDLPKVRTIAVTASICMDFATPDLFVDLQAPSLTTQRPQIILAPARTWDIAVGQFMWEQAKQRALELGSMVLWCDDGEGGVSGIAAPEQGINEVMVTGKGSWVRTIGLKFPADDRKTPYVSMGGSLSSIVIIWILVLSRSLVRVIPNFKVVALASRAHRSFLHWREARRERKIQETHEPNLLMDD